MKNIFKSSALALVLLASVGCDTETKIFDEATFVQLGNDNSVSVVENSGATVTISAILGSPQSSDVSVNFDVTGTATADRYTLSATSVSIPAGETSASVTFTPIDNDVIDGDVDFTLTLSSSSSLPLGIGGEGVNAISKTITIVDDNVPCNDYTISVTTDRWGSETAWDILDSSGNVVAQDGPYTDVADEVYDTAITLADGCYTFRIYDRFGDGQDTGSYLVSCGALVQASGSGNLDGVPNFDVSSATVTFFTNNPFGTDGVNFVEATDFCVNQ